MNYREAEELIDERIADSLARICQEIEGGSPMKQAFYDEIAWLRS